MLAAIVLIRAWHTGEFPNKSETLMLGAAKSYSKSSSSFTLCLPVVVVRCHMRRRKRWDDIRHPGKCTASTSWRFARLASSWTLPRNACRGNRRHYSVHAVPTSFHLTQEKSLPFLRMESLLKRSDIKSPLLDAAPTAVRQRQAVTT